MSTTIEVPDRMFRIGEVVWAKLRGFPKWPGMILHPEHGLNMKFSKQKPAYLVEFFSVTRAEQMAWITVENIDAYEQGRCEMKKLVDKMAVTSSRSGLGKTPGVYAQLKGCMDLADQSYEAFREDMELAATPMVRSGLLPMFAKSLKPKGRRSTKKKPIPTPPSPSSPSSPPSVRDQPMSVNREPSPLLGRAEQVLEQQAPLHDEPAPVRDKPAQTRGKPKPIRVGKKPQVLDNSSPKISVMDPLSSMYNNGPSVSGESSEKRIRVVLKRGGKTLEPSSERGTKRTRSGQVEYSVMDPPESSDGGSSRKRRSQSHNRRGRSLVVVPPSEDAMEDYSPPSVVATKMRNGNHPVMDFALESYDDVTFNVSKRRLISLSPKLAEIVAKGKDRYRFMDISGDALYIIVRYLNSDKVTFLGNESVGMEVLKAADKYLMNDLITRLSDPAAGFVSIQNACKFLSTLHRNGLDMSVLFVYIAEDLNDFYNVGGMDYLVRYDVTLARNMAKSLMEKRIEILHSESAAFRS